MSEIKNIFLYELSLMKESEDHIEFKEAKRDFNFDGGKHTDPKERRHCILGMWRLWLMKEAEDLCSA